MNGKATESISGCMEIYKKTVRKKLFISVTLVWNYKNTMTHCAKQVFFLCWVMIATHMCGSLQ